MYFSKRKRSEAVALYKLDGCVIFFFIKKENNNAIAPKTATATT